MRLRRWGRAEGSPLSRALCSEFRNCVVASLPSSRILQGFGWQLTDRSPILRCKAAEILKAAFERDGHYAGLLIGMSQELRRPLKPETPRELTR